MLRLEDPQYLWLLLIVPLLALLRLVAWQRQQKRLRLLGEVPLLRQLSPRVSRLRPTIKTTLLLAAIALLVVMLARPQMGKGVQKEKKQGIEVIICLDVSRSMLAQDVTPSRLEKSKMMVESLVDHFNNDKVGLVVFAGDAFVQLPITSDYVSAKMFLHDATPSLIANQGTDLGRAITLGTRSFTQQEKVGKAIVVITDGEDHEGGALEAAQEARKRGIEVYIIGVGSTQGAPIPAENGGWMKDQQGQTVLSALNEQMCQEVARAGKGTYIHMDNTSSAQQMLSNRLSKLQRGETTVVDYSNWDEQFQPFGLLVLLLLAIEAMTAEAHTRRWEWLKRWLQRPSTRAIVLFLTLLSALAAQAQTDRDLVRSGNRYFKNQSWAKAEVDYRKALAKNANNTQALYNLGCVLFAQQKDSLAMAMLEKAAKQETIPMRRAKAWHNIGVVLQSHQIYAQAIEAYKESLRLNPNDNETRYNLALCQRLLKKQPPIKNNQNKQQQQNKDKQKQQSKQQQQQQNKTQQQKAQQSNEQMSKENAEQLLNAAVQQERATQRRMQEQQRRQSTRRLQKQW